MAFARKSAAAITPELLDRLNSLAEKPDISQQDVDQIRFRAQALKKSAPEDFFMLEGLCASLLKDVPGVVENFRRAIDIEGWRADVTYNYMVALQEAGAADQGREIAIEGLSRFPDQPVFLKNTVAYLSQGGFLLDAAKAEQLLIKLQALSSETAAWLSFTERLTAEGADADAVGSIIKRTRQFLSDEGFGRVIGLSSFAFGPDGPCHLSCGFGIPGGPSAVREVERKLHSRVLDWADQIDGELSETSVLDWVTIYLSAEFNEHNANLHAA